LIFVSGLDGIVIESSFVVLISVARLDVADIVLVSLSFDWEKLILL